MTIKILPIDGFCGIEIENPMADPLATEDLGLIFKRFWRKDAAREVGQHAGIGLSLVKSYVELMELGIYATITGDQFRMRLSRLKIV